MNRTLALESFRNATPIFVERNENFALFRRICIIILIIEAIVIYVLSLWLTKPIKKLSRATKIMAGGNYSHRAEKISDDELGALTDEFNKMAQSLEEHMEQLEREATAKEDFVAAMAHELKTPLTSIIGYSDYIFNEGKRLESLSLKLLDLIVLRRHEIQLTYVRTKDIFGYLSEIYAGNSKVSFRARYDKAVVIAEASLIKTVLVNLVDNAVKSTPQGGSITVSGAIDYDDISMPGERAYVFEIADNGIGIPEEELSRITEAFYMVDKSRSKSRQGAGVGLALCAEILSLHESRLQFDSVLGEGTTVRFSLRCLYNNVRDGLNS